MITVFTTTYNRAHLLPDLYHSLYQQSCKDFEWIVIDDGSTDQTRCILEQWKNECVPFPIHVFFSENKGKCLQLNEGIRLARGEYFLIVDSDDYLVPNAIELVSDWVHHIHADNHMAGVSGLKVNPDYSYIRGVEPVIPKIPGYVDATVHERKKYSLEADMAECYRTSLLKKYPFQVWPGEKFASEGQVWNAIADDGYKIRWYKEPLMVVRYQEDGLTKGYWKLLKENPMAFASMFSGKFRRAGSLKEKFYAGSECIACLCLAGNLGLLRQFLPNLSRILLLPAGLVLFWHRKRQIRQYTA